MTGEKLLRVDAPKSLQNWNHRGHWNFLRITTLYWNVGLIINWKSEHTSTIRSPVMLNVFKKQNTG